MPNPDAHMNDAGGKQAQERLEKPPVGSLTQLKIRRVFSVPLSEKPLAKSLEEGGALQSGTPDSVRAKPSVQERESACILKKSNDASPNAAQPEVAPANVPEESERKQQPEGAGKASGATAAAAVPPPCTAVERPNGNGDANVGNANGANGSVSKVQHGAHGPNRRIQTPEALATGVKPKTPHKPDESCENAANSAEKSSGAPVTAKSPEAASDKTRDDAKEPTFSLAQRAQMRAEAALARRPFKSEAPKGAKRDAHGNARPNRAPAAKIPQDILAYWSQQRKGRAFPNVSDMDSETIRRAWPNSLLIRCTSDKRKFEPIVNFARSAEKLNLPLETPRPATAAIEISPMMLQWLLDLAREAQEESRPVESRDSFPNPRGPTDFKATALPLSADQQAIDHILCHVAAL